MSGGLTRGATRPQKNAPLRARVQITGRLLGVMICLVGLLAPGASPQDHRPLEYQVKAAFLLNFARFISWPPEAFASAHAPLKFCVVGHDPFGKMLDETLKGQSVDDHPLVARRVSGVNQLGGCQVIFIGERDDRRLEEVLQTEKDASVLIIGEGADFARRGGGLQFYLQDNKIRFCANVNALKRARLSVSSKLLALAEIVRDKSSRGDI